GRAVPVCLVLVAVGCVALAWGGVAGLLAGTIGGLAQDALGGGIVGIGGMTKTLIGFFVGVLSAQFNLSTTVPRLVMFVAATFVHGLMFGGLQAITGSGRFSVKMSAVLLQALVNGFVGAGAFLLVENGPPGLAHRRRRRGTVARGGGCGGARRVLRVVRGRRGGGARGSRGWGFCGCLGFGVLRVPRVRGSAGSSGSGFCGFLGFGVLWVLRVRGSAGSSGSGFCEFSGFG